MKLHRCCALDGTVVRPFPMKRSMKGAWSDAESVLGQAGKRATYAVQAATPAAFTTCEGG
jgi:hypothetical protein